MSAAAQPPRLVRALDEGAYWWMWVGIGSLVRLGLQLRVHGSLPPSGPVVVVANHSSFLDPVVVGAASRRRIAFLMDALLFRAPAMCWFYRWNRAIPIDRRGRNRDALRRARDVLRAGGVLGVFPEGGISRDGEPLLGNPGAVSLALAERAAVVPVGIVGADEALPPWRRLPRPRQVTVRFGKPILDLGEDGDRRQRVARAARRVMDEIAALTGKTSREAVLARVRAGLGSS